MASEWIISPLGSLPIEIIDGDRSSKYPKRSEFVSNGILFLNTTNIRDNRLVVDLQSNFISCKKFDQIKKGRVVASDILMTTRGANLGTFAIFSSSYETALINAQMLIIRPDAQYIDPKYLYYSLISPETQQKLSAYRTGSAQPQLPIRDLKRIPVRIVKSQSAQRKIAGILGMLDNKIVLNQRMNVTLEGMVRALFQSWFVDFDPVRAKLDGRKPSGIDNVTAAFFPVHLQESTLGRIPQGWEVSTIGTKLSTVLGGTPSRTRSEYWTDGTVAWINSGKANEFRIIDPSEWITQEALENSATKLLPRRTTVLAITGATLGQVSITEIECCANQSVVAIPASEEFPTEFIYPWILENIDKLISSQTGGAQQHVNKGNVNELALLCPDRRVMNAYLSKAKPLFDQIAANCFQSRTLTTLRDTLLPKLLSGDLSVTESFRHV